MRRSGAGSGVPAIDAGLGARGQAMRSEVELARVCKGAGSTDCGREEPLACRQLRPASVQRREGGRECEVDEQLDQHLQPDASRLQPCF